MNDQSGGNGIDVESLKEGGIVSIRDYLLQLQSNGEKIARTESGDPSFSIPKIVKKEIEKALKEDKTHYTPGAGIKPLREAIFKKLTQENKIFLNNYSDIIVTNGAMNALYVVFQSIMKCSNGRDEILVPTPTWTETVENVSLANGKPVYYKIDPFVCDPIKIEELKKLVNGKTIAIVINSPHNPTGVVLSKKFLTKLVDFCYKNDLYLVSDEAYEHIIFKPFKHYSPAFLVSEPNQLNKIISIFSCSKSYAMSGLRVGYIVTINKPIQKVISKMVRCTINGVNSISQYGAITAILDTPKSYFKNMNKAYVARRKTLFDALVKCSFLEPILPNGAFYVWAKILDERSGWDVCKYLLENGIGSAPGEVFGPGGIGYIRFAFSCQDDHIAIAAEKLQKL